jgi:Flp pilus assembly protein TadD
VLQAKGSPDEAVAAYQATLEENPKATAALQGLVSVWTQNDQADKAVSYLKDYMEKFPDVTEARFLLAAVYVQQNKYADASREFETVIAAQPQAVRPYVALAALYPEETAKREEVYRRGLEQIPGEPQLSLLLASQLEREQRVDDAMAVYEATLEVNADNLIAVNNLAALLLDYRSDDSSHARALELARQLESSEQAPLLDTVGWAYYRNGDFFTAVRYLERAVAGAGQVPILRYHLGMAYAATNNSAGARQELTQALAESETQFTGVEEARAKLAELESS